MTKISSGKGNDEDNETSIERGHWKRPIEFILSVLGYAIGLSSIWRFPYLAMRNGGGAFLVPYVIFILLIGIPLVSLETALGQYFQLSPLLLFDICPLFKGVGASITILAFLGYVYYMLILAWSLYFLAMSCSSVLPWSTCDNSWNTNSCIPLIHSYFNSTNGSLISQTSNQSGYLATEEYWRFNVLDISSGIDDLGNIRWQLLIALLISFVLLYLCIFKGIESSRIAVYITATLPFVLLIMLLVWLLTRPGSTDGLLYLFIPRWDRITKYQTWLEASLHVFFSLGPGWGGLINLASYNPFHHNCLRDSIIVSIADMLTAILCGAVVFAGVGCIAYQTNSKVEDVITTGPGLSFITYPQVVASMPVPQLWSICFFLLIVFLGLDSQFAMVKTVTAGITDLYPKRLKKYEPLVVLCVLLFSILVCLPFVTQAGIYIFQIVDWYIVIFTIIVIAFCEGVIVSWIYGDDRFLSNIEEMGSFAPTWYLQCLKFAWKYVIPVFMLSVLILIMVKFRSPTLGDYVYPEWTNVFGWILALSSSLPIPAVMVYQLATTQGTLSQRIKRCTRPVIGKKGQRITDLYLEEMSELTNVADKDMSKKFTVPCD